MDNPILKKFLPHVLSIALIATVAFVFFSPVTFGGRVLQQYDNQKVASSQTEINYIFKKTGKPPLWTNAMFSGMPTVQIHQKGYGNLTEPIFYASILYQSVTAPHTQILLAMLCMYILLCVMRLDWRLALTGAFAFGLSSFNMDIIEAGHSTKMLALAFTPLVIAGALLVLRGRLLLGGGIFALATALQVSSNHYQITYYAYLTLAVILIVEGINAIRSGKILDFSKAIAVLAIGFFLGVGSNMTGIWTTFDYQTESTRGKSELTKKEDGASSQTGANGGLSQDYAFQWSYGISEMLTLLVQNTVGGGASQTHEGTQLYDMAFQQQVAQMTQQGTAPDLARKQAAQQISAAFYTGPQPFVGVSIYYGAVICFLFLMSLFLVKTNLKWGLLAATILMLLIGWGKNTPFAPMMFDYFPFFNKFRAVTQALGLGQMLFIIGAMLGLQAWFDNSIESSKKLRALGISVGIIVLLAGIATMGDFIGGKDEQFGNMAATIQADRAALAKSDAGRAIFLTLATATLLFLALRGVIQKSWIAVAAIGLLCFGDSWTAAKRVMTEDKFLTKQEAKAVSDQPTAADKKILADTDPYYRVLDLRQGNPFSDATASNFHKSIGGYHAAKMMRYQEMVEAYLGKFDQKTPIPAQKNMPLFGMLNAKYIIMSNDEAGAMLNPFALGNAWFVKKIQVVENGDAEMASIGSINPKETAVIQKQYAESLKGFQPQFDSTATIRLTHYHPDSLQYAYEAKSEQLALFSEVYYPSEKGWKVLLDGKPYDAFVKANYIIRALKVPAGKHTLAMIYAPKAYYTGETISYFASGSLLLLVALGLFFAFRQGGGLPDAEQLTDLVVETSVKPKPQPQPKATPTPQPNAPAQPKKRKLK